MSADDWDESVPQSQGWADDTCVAVDSYAVLASV